MTDKEREAALELAEQIADLACAHINLRKGEVNHKYSAQWLLEETIKILQERV